MSTPIDGLSIDARGREFPVSVDTAGRFVVEVDGIVLMAPSLELLRPKVVAATRSYKLSIPVVCRERDRYRRGVVVGIHGGTGSPMVRWDGESRNTQHGYGELLDGTVLSDADLTRLTELIAEQHRLGRELFALEKKARFNYRAAMAAASGPS